MTKVGAAWKRQGKKGEFLSVKVTLGGTEYSALMFRNKYKGENDKKPEYEIFISDDEEAPPRQAAQTSDDDVPF